jgi:maltokinase
VSGSELLADLRAHWPPAGGAARADYTGAALAATAPVAVLDLGGTGARRHAVAVAVGPAGLHTVPLTAPAGGRWRRAAPGDGTAAALVHRVTTAPGPSGGFTVHPGRPTGVTAADRTERSVATDQTNEAVIVAERSVVKWVRRPSSGDQPAMRLPAHLDAVGFASIPAVQGFLTWRPAGAEVVLLAGIDAYLPGASDGWEWCADALLGQLRGGGPAGFAARLGTLAADLHGALATPSSVLPQPVATVGVATVARWHSTARRSLDRALELTVEVESGRLHAIADTLGRVLDELTAVPAATVQPVHGDLHVGQLLRWRDGLAVIDFEGNPTPGVTENGAAQPAARDLAQLLCSVGHVGRIADRRTGGEHLAEIERWIAGSRAALLDAYRSRLGRLGRGDLLDDRLLAPFAVEQQCRELIYAATCLPRWSYAPLAELHAAFEIS